MSNNQKPATPDNTEKLIEFVKTIRDHSHVNTEEHIRIQIQAAGKIADSIKTSELDHHEDVVLSATPDSDWDVAEHALTDEDAAEAQRGRDALNRLRAKSAEQEKRIIRLQEIAASAMSNDIKYLTQTLVIPEGYFIKCCGQCAPQKEWWWMELMSVDGRRSGFARRENKCATIQQALHNCMDDIGTLNATAKKDNR